MLSWITVKVIFKELSRDGLSNLHESYKYIHQLGWGAQDKMGIPARAGVLFQFDTFSATRIVAGNNFHKGTMPADGGVRNMIGLDNYEYVSQGQDATRDICLLTCDLDQSFIVTRMRTMGTFLDELLLKNSRRCHRP